MRFCTIFRLLKRNLPIHVLPYRKNPGVTSMTDHLKELEKAFQDARKQFSKTAQQTYKTMRSALQRVVISKYTMERT